MKHVRTIALSLSIAAFSVAAVGCSGSESTSRPQTSASAATKAPIGQNTHGLVKTVGDALGDVPLRPEQRTEIEKLVQDAETRHVAMAPARKELMLAFADQVEKGSIDKAALRSKVDKVVAGIEKVRPDDTAALARLHAILDAEQRNEFVDALETRMREHRRHGKHHDKAKAEGEAAPRDPGKDGEHLNEHPFMRMHQLAEEMKLTTEQKAQIGLVFAETARDHHKDFAQMRAKMKEGKEHLETFRTETFDAKAMPMLRDDTAREKLEEGSVKIAGVAEKILPILTPEQRKIAADKIRAAAESGHDAFGAH